MARTLRTVVAMAFILVGAPFGSARLVQAEAAISLEARLAQAVLKAGEAHTTYLRIGLKGCDPGPNRERIPLNVAFVVDRSGSMAGERLAQARAAAGLAIDRLGPDDIAGVVTFDHAADLLVAAQPVVDRAVFSERIARISAGGSTAIHDGVLRGAAEVRKYKDGRRLNRLVLLSDGQANVGPRHPADFAALGAALGAEGISVSTIGLGAGYNEDLMLELARASDGNHAFARDPSDLISIFNREFDDALGTCAQTVAVALELAPGARVLRALSRQGVIEKGNATFRFNQIYAAAEHYVLVELELDKALTMDVGERELGVVSVGYARPNSASRDTVNAPIRVSFSASAEAVAAARDGKVEEAVLEQITRQRAQQAIRLKDAGNSDQARQLLLENAKALEAYLAAAPTSPTRLIELNKHYQALTAPAPEKTLHERKLLRALDLPTAGSSSRY